MENSGITGGAPLVDDSAFVDPSAQLGPGCAVSPFAYVGAGVKIGARTTIGPGAVILEGTTIGEDCVIAGEVVLGSRGFGYTFDGTQHVRIPQVGAVNIGDRTTIGPASCIDRAAVEATVLGADCRIGSLVQVGHNCVFGDDCWIGGGSAIAGTSRVGRGGRFGERIGVAGHSHYGENVRIDDLSAVVKTRIPSDSHWTGYPGRMVSS